MAEPKVPKQKIPKPKVIKGPPAVPLKISTADPKDTAITGKPFRRRGRKVISSGYGPTKQEPASTTTTTTSTSTTAPPVTTTTTSTTTTTTVVGEMLMVSYLTDSNFVESIRDTINRTKIGETYVSPAIFDITRVVFKLKKVGSPTGNIWCESWDTSGGNPIGLRDTSDSVDVSTLPTTQDFVEFVFDPPANININGGTFAIVLAGDFTMNDIDYAQAWGKDPGDYAGTGKKWNGSTWSNMVGDLYFKIFGVVTATTTTLP